MRKCKSCQSFMDYNYQRSRWECSECGFVVEKVTINGDRILNQFEEWN